MKTLIYSMTCCLLCSVISGKVENVPIIINNLLTHFEINVFDHIVFLSDKGEEIQNDDKNLFGYHQTLNDIKLLNLFTQSNYKKMNSYNNIHRSLQSLTKAPVLFHVSVPRLNMNNGTFLQLLSTSELSNHVWLLDFDFTDNCNRTMVEIQTWLKSSIINLNFDSQVALLTPEKLRCDKNDVYEVYKVYFIRVKINQSI